MMSAQADFTVLQVVGFCASYTNYEGHRIDLVFGENKDKCDPAVGFVSIEDQKIHFEESLALKNITFSEFKLEIASSVKQNEDYTRIEAYSYETIDSSEISTIAELAVQQFIEVDNVGHPLQKRDLAEQDEAAICAIKDATQRAEAIAEHLGYKNCQLLSVDDETTGIRSNAFLIMLQEAKAKRKTGYNYPNAYSIIGNYKMY